MAKTQHPLPPFAQHLVTNGLLAAAQAQELSTQARVDERPLLLYLEEKKLQPFVQKRVNSWLEKNKEEKMLSPIIEFLNAANAGTGVTLFPSSHQTQARLPSHLWR